MSEPIVDSAYGSLEEALEGTLAPASVTDTLALIEVEYLSFDGRPHAGQVVMRADLEAEVREIFEGLLAMGFPVEKVIPVVAYGWDDILSMEDNNSAGFNYRTILGTQDLSNHSYGLALDLNPRLNPYHARNGNIYPIGATYDGSVPGTIMAGDAVVTLFERKGWTWLGARENYADYQHFQKRM